MILQMNVLKDLNVEQKKAVTHGAGPLLIVAGAGTGKTTVITRRIGWLILNKKLKANEVLALTFTEKAAEEMDTRVDKLLPLGYEDLWINTFHEFGKRILAENALDIGLDPQFKILTQTDQYLFIRQHLFEFELDYYRPLGNPARFIQSLTKFFSRLKDEEIDDQEFLRYARHKSKKQNSKTGKNSPVKIKNKEEVENARKIMELAGAYQKYQELMRQASYLDFGDLIMYPLKLFRKRPSVLGRFQRQFKYILVDEFQDTNFAQYQLLKLLSADQGNLNVVGDDDQSIYRFRGAALNNILNFKKQFPRAQEIVLTTNYRSLPGILDAAYDLIQGNNPDRLETRLNIQKQLRIGRDLSAAEKKVRPTLFWEETMEQEAKTVAREIIRLRKEAEYDWRDFAVLVRANDHAEPFIKVLERANLPYLFVASKGLYHTPEVMGLIAYLRTLNNFLDSVSLYRVTHMAVFDFDPQDVIRLLQQASRKSLSLYEVFDGADSVAGLKDNTRQSIKKLLGLLKKQAAEARQKKVSEVLVNFINESGYLEQLRKKETLEEEQRFQNIVELFKRIQQFQKTDRDTHTVRDFVAELELATEGGEDPAPAEIQEGPDTIKVMTVHKAKGLEFPAVFLISLVEGHFPPQEKSDPLPIPSDLLEEDLPLESRVQEERRLFYVGMTRAKERLYLTGAEDYGGKRKRKLSRFCREIEGKIDLRRSESVDELLGQQKLFSGGKASIKMEYQLPAKFSFTQLEAFEKCPLQYKFAHLLKIPTDSSFTFSYGKSLHETLRDFYTVLMAGKVPSEKELLKMLDENWINEWYHNKKHEQESREKGEQALRDFYRKNKNDFGRPLYVEKEFNMKLGPYVLRGKIDRVDKLPNGQVEVVDYKSGHLKNYESDTKRMRQLMLYALALKQIFNLKPAKLTLYYLEDNEAYSLAADKFESKLTPVAQSAIKVFDAIKTSDFPPKPGAFVCQYCDFKMICPYRK